MAGICLLIQMRSGLFLASHYSPHVDLAFLSVEHIIKEVPGGWLIRSIHRNGASVFFMVVYFHLLRGLFYRSSSRPREGVWLSGFTLLLLLIRTAFLGYVLPWGQISFWGATVISSLRGAIPVIGPDIVEWLWGGFCVHNATLNRFFRLHFRIPFLMRGVRGVHVLSLHQYGSTNPSKRSLRTLTAKLYPNYWWKDLVAWRRFLFFFRYWVFFHPDWLGHVDNARIANPLVTPTHIVPEWYFLWVYALLRSIPSKLGGMIVVFLRLLCLRTLSFYRKRFPRLFSHSRRLFWGFRGVRVFLSFLGAQNVERPFIALGALSIPLFFFFFRAHRFQTLWEGETLL